MSVIVTRLSITPIKGTRLRSVESVALGSDGAEGNRRFFVIDERDRMVNAKQIGGLQTVVASCSDGVLRLSFADGVEVEGPVRAAGSVTTRFFSRMRPGTLVDGPFAGALSERMGTPLRLVEAEGSAVDRGAVGGVSLISSASLQRLAAQAGRGELDARRFRMLLEVDGLEAHEEDGWVRRTARVGGARVRWGGHVGRCLVTGRDPESGVSDLPTLDLLRDYRGDADTTEALPFGIYGAVLEPGPVRVGDTVTLDGA